MKGYFFYTSIVRVKICCISSIEEARLAINMGASALGLVGDMPSGPGILDDQEIDTIRKHIPPGISSVLLTSETTTNAIAEHHNRVHTDTIQIVDQLSSGSYDDLRLLLPGVRLMQVIHVLDQTAIDEALNLESRVDAILLDSGNPNLSVKELGGTGRKHDWEISKKLVEMVSIPVFLAGGLNPSNIEEAIDTVNPYGVDICSGVRIGGKIRSKAIRRFFCKNINSLRR